MEENHPICFKIMNMPFHLSTYLVPLLPYVEVWLTQRYGIGLFTTRSFTPDIDDKVPLEILKKRLTTYTYVRNLSTHGTRF